MYRISPFVRHFAWALLGGAGLATLKEHIMWSAKAYRQPELPALAAPAAPPPAAPRST